MKGDSQLVMNCISGQIYDSSPVDFTGDLGARFALPPTILKLPGSAKLASLVAKGVTSSLDALFLTRFGSERSEYWQTLYSSVVSVSLAYIYSKLSGSSFFLQRLLHVLFVLLQSLGSPYLILCSEHDDISPYPIICNFAHQLQDLGGSVQLFRLKGSTHVG